MSDEKSVEAAIMDGDIGPHTCRSCCAPTWNDWEVCDECENEASDLSDADELSRLRSQVERLTAERDTAKKYMAAYAECDLIGTEAYRNLADQHDGLRAEMERLKADGQRIVNESAKMLSEDAVDYNRKTNAMIERHARQIEELRTALADERQRAEELAKALSDADTILGTYIALFGDISGKQASQIKGLHGMRHST